MSSVSWADVAVVPLIAILCVPPLLWSAHHPWAIVHTDAPRYLLAASQLVSGHGLESPSGISNYNGGQGDVSLSSELKASHYSSAKWRAVTRARLPYGRRFA